MRGIITKFALAGLFIFVFSTKSRANDSLTLAQAYINLSLTCSYFDTLSTQRIAAILPFMEQELAGIRDTGFIRENNQLYSITYSSLYYAKARLIYKLRKEISRPRLLQWKNMLEKSIVYFNKAAIIPVDTGFERNSYFGLIHFTQESCSTLSGKINDLKAQFYPYFCKDIYPDFQRIFFRAKNENKFYIRDSLSYFSSLYNIPIEFRILDNTPLRTRAWEEFSGASLSTAYALPTAFDLISEYLQLLYIAKKQARVRNVYNLYDNYFSFKYSLNPESSTAFRNDYTSTRETGIPKDQFFNRELDTATCARLYRVLQRKYPYQYVKKMLIDTDGDGITDIRNESPKYYFPTPVPFPSSSIAINHFHPQLATMKQVDDYIRSCFIRAGYAGRLHYYFIHENGYAVTTSLERINKEGGPAAPDQRWNLSVNDGGKLSLYSVFKTIFFQTQSDFRIIGCVVAAREAAKSSRPPTMNEMAALTMNSYDALPVELENLRLADKTLTILVYHFYQSDIGQVPLLDTRQRLSVYDHLNSTSSLKQLANQ